MSCDGPAEPSPWALISEQPKFDCQYFTARADMVSQSGGLARPYHHFRMKYYGVYVVPIDAEGYPLGLQNKAVHGVGVRNGRLSAQSK
jgi:hypothetical protein